MPFDAAIRAFVQLALMLAVVTAYVILARRRFQVLWHPLAIIAAVGIVGVTVSIFTTMVYGEGVGAVPDMARRSAIGAFGWGAVIAAMVWICRRGYAWWAKS